MYGKLLLFILLGVCACADAQELSMTGKVTKQIFKQKAALHVQVPNLQLGKEALRLHFSSVGMGDYASSARRYEQVFRARSSGQLLESLKVSSLGIAPLPGYIYEAHSLASFDPAKEAVILDGVYGPKTQYKGVFVSTFEELRALSYRPVQAGTDALSSLNEAKQASAKLKFGFLALVIKGNAYRPKDVLIWNPGENSWISWNYSKASALRLHRETMQKEFKDQNAYWSRQLEKQGVVIRPDVYDTPSSIRISADGVNWQEYGLDSELGAELWQAWNEGFYISYDRHAHKARFALTKQDPLFSTLEDVFLWQTRTFLPDGR